MKNRVNSFPVKGIAALKDVFGGAKKRYMAYGLENKVAFWSSIVGLLMLLFPWVTYTPLRSAITHTPFGSVVWALALILFICTATVLFFYAQSLFDFQAIRLRIPRSLVLLIAGALGLLMALLSWTVLMSTGRAYGDVEIRFGLIITILCQLCIGTAGGLLLQEQRQNLIKSFFNLE